MNKLLEFIKNVWKRICEKRRENAKNEIRKKAEHFFDVSVYDNELWLVCDCCLICPMRMFENKDTSMIVEEMRKLYIERKEKE